jgi:hypothetical protein
VPIIRIKSGNVLIVGGDLDGLDTAAIQAPFDDAPGTLTITDTDLGATRVDAIGGVVARGNAILTISKGLNVGPDRATVDLQDVRFDKAVETAGGTSIRVGSTVVDQLTKTRVTFKAGQTGTPAQVVFEDWPSLISPRFRSSSIVAYRPTVDRAGFAIQAKFKQSSLSYGEITIDSVQPVKAKYRTSTVATYRPTLSAIQVIVMKFRSSTVITRRPTIGAVQPIVAKFRTSTVATYRPTLSATQIIRAPLFRFSTVRAFRPLRVDALQPILAKFRPSSIRTFRPPSIDVLPVRAKYRTSTVVTFRPTISAFQPIKPKFRLSSVATYRPRVQSEATIVSKFRGSSIVSYRPVLVVFLPLQLVITAPHFRSSTVQTFRPNVTYFQLIRPKFRTSSILGFRPQVTGGATGTESDWFGPILNESTLEDALVAQLKDWFPSTLAEVYRQAGRNDMLSHSAVTWQRWDITEAWPINALPAVLVSVTGAPEWRTGPTSWDAMFTGEVTVAVAAGTYADSRRLAQRTLAALRLGLTARTFQDGVGIEITDSRVGTIGTPGRLPSKVVSLASVSVELFVSDVQRRYSSLITPPPTHTPPTPDQLAETVNVRVISEED